MLYKRDVIEFGSLPKSIQDDICKVREMRGQYSYYEFDVLSDENKNEWLSRVDDEYTKSHCRISDYLKSIGAEEGMNSVIVLRWW